MKKYTKVLTLLLGVGIGIGASGLIGNLQGPQTNYVKSGIEYLQLNSNYENPNNNNFNSNCNNKNNRGCNRQGTRGCGVGSTEGISEQDSKGGEL